MLQKLCLVLLFVTITVDCQTVGSFRKDSVQHLRPRRHGAGGGGGGDFQNLFNVYDPSYLSAVWPKLRNGVHLLVDLSCWDELTVFFKDLAVGKAWAFDVVDASGRYPSGAFAGTRYWLGSKERCLAMSDDFISKGHNETLTALRSNDYVNAILRREKNYESDEEWRWMIHDDTMLALLAAEHRPPFPLAYTALQIQLNVTKFVMYKSYMITVGVCLPRSCSTEDVEAVVRFSLALTASSRTNTSVPRVARVVAARQVDGHYDLADDTGTVVLIAFTLTLLVLAIVATVVDLNLIKCFPYSKKSMSFDLPQYRNPETKLVDELKRKHTRVMNVDALVEHATLNSIAMKKPCGAVEAGSCLRCGKYRRQCAGVNRPPPTPRATYSSFASLSTEDRRNKFLWKLLLCFSIRNGLNRIFNDQTVNKDLALIHGIKIFATFWVVFIHVAVIASFASNNAGDLNEQEDVYYILTTGTLAFDTLFFVSGLISSHHFFYLKSRYSVKELVNFSGRCGQIMQFVCFVTNRVVRLLPSYAYMVATTAALARASRAFTALSAPDTERDLVACDLHWWRNLLYITTAYPTQEQCMQVSWFLSTETQLHALGALACAASASRDVSVEVSRDASVAGSRSRGKLRARLVLAVAAAFVLAAIAADLSEAYVANEISYSSAYSMYEAVIARSWARAAPYAAGVFTGWLVHALGGHLTLNKTGGYLAWAASLVLGGGALALSAAGAWRGVAWVSCWQHAAWPAALLWPALVATTTYSGVFGSALGGRGGAALARLSYGVLVCHGVAARLLLPDRPLYSDPLSLWSYFSVTLSGSVAGALVLAVLVEMPVCKLLRTLSDSAV